MWRTRCPCPCFVFLSGLSCSTYICIWLPFLPYAYYMWLPWFISFLFLGFSSPAFSGTHGDRGIFIFPVQLTTIRIGNLTRLIHTLLYVTTIHTCIHTYIHIEQSSSLILIIEQRWQNFPKCTHDYRTLDLEYHAFVINDDFLLKCVQQNAIPQTLVFP